MQIFDTFKCSSQNLSNSLCQFWNDKWIPLQILHHSPLSWKRTPLYFLPQTLHILVKSSPLKCKYFSFLIARLEIYQIPYVNFELTSQFFFKSCIILHSHDTQLLCNFLAHVFSILDKRILSKSQFWHFQVFWWKFAKFTMSFSKPQVSLSSNFAWPFSVIQVTRLYFLGQTLCT